MKEEKRKQTFRRAFRDELQRQNVSTEADPTIVSRILTRFYVEKVLRRLRPGFLPDDPDDIADCYIDGKLDRGVDFVYRSDEGAVVLIQAKYRATDKLEKAEDIDFLVNALKRYHPATGEKLRKNSKAELAFADIDWDQDTFQLLYVTLGRVADDVRATAEDVADPGRFPAISGFSDRVEILILSESELNEELKEAESTGEMLHEEVELRLAKPAAGPPWMIYENEQGVRSYVGIIGAPQLRRLYEEKNRRNRLFSLNIRNYVGDTSTNKDILKTAINSPGAFFFYNNGISAVASKIEEDPNTCTLRCTRLSVVNGAQTVRSLWRAHKQDPANVAKAFVSIRVSEVPFRDDEFLKNVTQYNNTQNAIKISDFRSNDPVQIQLAQRFSALPARGGKKFVYRNKRTERDSTKIAVGMEEFAKTVHAFKFGPADTLGGTRYLFDLTPTGGYAKVFGNAEKVWDVIDSEDFEELAGIWFLCEQARTMGETVKAEMAEKEAAKGTTPPIVKDALERRWVLFYAVGELLRAKYGSEGMLSPILRKLSDPRWTATDGYEKEVLNRYVKAAAEILVRVYRSASKSQDFVHRNWFRSKTTREEIVAAVSDYESLLDILPLFK